MAGLALIVLGTAMVGIAATLFVRIAKNIDREDVSPGTGSRIDIALAGLLVLGLRSIPLFVHALVTKPLKRAFATTRPEILIAIKIGWTRPGSNITRR
jgi:hypothetical protein